MTISKQNLSFLSLVGVIAVAGCAYSPASTSQRVTFLAPDVQDVQCFVTVDERDYNVSLPETIDVKVSANDMHLSCNTSDDRTLEQTVSPNVTTRADWGGAMGGDYSSTSTYRYPSVVSVGFSQVKSQEVVNNISDDEILLEPLSGPDDVMSDTQHKEEISDDSVVEVDSEPTDLQTVIDDLSDDDKISVSHENNIENKAVLEAEAQPVSIYSGQ